MGRFPDHVPRAAHREPRPLDLAIVGGGAAGLFAAVVAGALGVRCLVLERKARIGAKLLMTANGRCNFAKDISVERFLADVDEPVASFVAPALRLCPPERIVAGFRVRGLAVKRMQDGRFFPASEKAADVVHVFGDALRNAEIPLAVNCPVSALRRLPQGGFCVETPNFAVAARHVLVATGGASFPKTGSVGDGQRFARELGLRVTPLEAGLTGFELPLFVARARARKQYNMGAAARVVVKGETRFRAAGEVAFEPWGVSGAAVYNCQRWTARHLAPGVAWELALDLPDGVLSVPRPVPRPLKEAIVTLGGVAREEIDPETMEARKIPGLHFAGEVLDVDGPTGGYNLSLAFATAHLAVSHVAGACKSV